MSVYTWLWVCDLSPPCASRPNVLNQIYRVTVTEYVSGSHSNARNAQQYYPYSPDPPDNPQVSCCVCYWWRICAMMLPTSIREREERFPCRRRKDWWRAKPTDISFTFFFICVPFLAFSYLTVYSTFSSLAHRWIDAENQNIMSAFYMQCAYTLR